MKILAVDTSSKNCSVAIVEVDENKNFNVIVEKNSDDEKTHSQKLMPLVDSALKENNLSLNDINLLACCLGPGSFTGIRIGIATVKAFADAKNIPTVGVTSLESLAYNVGIKNLTCNEHLSNNSNFNTIICPIIDCKNENVYSALFSCKNNTYLQIGDNIAENVNIVLDGFYSACDIFLNRQGNLNNENIDNKNIDNNKTKTDASNKITFVGDGSILYKDLILEKFSNFTVEFAEKNVQSSISLAKCAYVKYLKGLYGDSNYISPLYLRKSQAERQQLEKNSLTISQMTINDLDEIKSILESDFDEFWNYETLKEELKSPFSKYIVARNSDNLIVGFAGIKIILDEAELMNIVTRKNMRGLGVASSMLEYIISYCKQHEIKKINLEVNSSNSIAINLYKKYNFKQIGFRKKYYNNTYDAILMNLSI